MGKRKGGGGGVGKRDGHGVKPFFPTPCPNTDGRAAGHEQGRAGSKLQAPGTAPVTVWPENTSRPAHQPLPDPNHFSAGGGRGVWTHEKTNIPRSIALASCPPVPPTALISRPKPVVWDQLCARLRRLSPRDGSAEIRTFSKMSLRRLGDSDDNRPDAALPGPRAVESFAPRLPVTT